MMHAKRSGCKSKMGRSRLILYFCTASAFAVLIGLGFWQLQRHAWKQALIAQVETQSKKPPLSFAALYERWQKKENIEYMPVQVSGQFLHKSERHVYALENKVSGWHVYTPLIMQSGEVVFINRGFVTDRVKAPENRLAGQTKGIISFTGLARHAPKSKSIFTPNNDEQKNQYYWRDHAAMSRFALGTAPKNKIIPFFIDGQEKTITGKWPKSSVTRITFSNRHMEYALTWFGLAAGLIGVFIVFLRSARPQKQL